jgi:integrase
MSHSENSKAQAVSPTVVNRKVPKRGPSTKARKQFLPSEVAALLKAAKRSGRYKLRDEAAILLAYRHGLRAEELV